jgi:hypothetical protein
VREIQTLLGVAMMAFQFEQAIAACTENNATVSKEVKPNGDITLKITVEEGNYGVYDLRNNKVTLLTPTSGQVNSVGKKVEHEIILKVGPINDTDDLQVVDAGRFLFVKLNTDRGSVTLYPTHVFIKDNEMQFEIFELAHFKVFNQRRKFVVPAVRNTELETIIAQLCENAGWKVTKMEPIGNYNPKLAAKGLPTDTGIVLNVDTTNEKADIMVNENGELFQVTMPWDDITDNSRDISTTSVLTHEGLENGQLTNAKLVLPETEVPA